MDSVQVMHYIIRNSNNGQLLASASLCLPFPVASLYVECQTHSATGLGIGRPEARNSFTYMVKYHCFKHRPFEFQVLLIRALLLQKLVKHIVIIINAHMLKSEVWSDRFFYRDCSAGLLLQGISL